MQKVVLVNEMKNEQIMIVEDDNELNRGLCTAFRTNDYILSTVSAFGGGAVILILLSVFG